MVVVVVDAVAAAAAAGVVLGAFASLFGWGHTWLLWTPAYGVYDHCPQRCR